MSVDARLLKLSATDEKDLNIMSGALQDAIVPIGDITYRPADKAFVFVANRFRWEAAEGGDSAERINAGVIFSNVVDVKRRGIDFRGRGQQGDASGRTSGLVTPGGQATEGRVDLREERPQVPLHAVELRGKVAHVGTFHLFGGNLALSQGTQYTLAHQRGEMLALLRPVTGKVRLIST